MEKFPLSEKDIVRLRRRSRHMHHKRIACPTKSTLPLRRSLKLRGNRLDRRKANAKIRIGVPIKFPLSKSAAQKGLPSWFKSLRGKSPKAA